MTARTRAGRAQVLVGVDGRVIAAVSRRGPGRPVENEDFGADEPTPEVAIVPGDGQSVHDVDLPDELLTDDGVNLRALGDYRLEPGQEGWLTR